MVKSSGEKAVLAKADVKECCGKAESENHATMNGRKLPECSTRLLIGDATFTWIDVRDDQLL